MIGGNVAGARVHLVTMETDVRSSMPVTRLRVSVSAPSVSMCRLRRSAVTVLRARMAGCVRAPTLVWINHVGMVELA